VSTQPNREDADSPSGFGRLPRTCGVLARDHVIVAAGGLNSEAGRWRR
jgi:hypothetical protein